MTPRIKPENIKVGDHVADKRAVRGMRVPAGVVVKLGQGCAQVRWDGTDHLGWRALSFLRKLERPAEP